MYERTHLDSKKFELPWNASVTREICRRAASSRSKFNDISQIHCELVDVVVEPGGRGGGGGGGGEAKSNVVIQRDQKNSK